MPGWRTSRASGSRRCFTPPNACKWRCRNKSKVQAVPACFGMPKLKLVCNVFLPFGLVCCQFAEEPTVLMLRNPTVAQSLTDGKSPRHDAPRRVTPR